MSRVQVHGMKKKALAEGASMNVLLYRRWALIKSRQSLA